MSSARRSSGALRQEQLESGGFLLEFKEPVLLHNPTMGFSDNLLNGIPLLDMKSSMYNSRRQRWRLIERKGFKVTTEGCLIPHPQYNQQAGSTQNGYRTSISFFTGFDGNLAQDRVINQFGWDATLERSHLCHRNECCNPSHIIVEPFWKNRKRNFCGYNGSCDCGILPKCIRRFQSSNTVDDPILCKNKEEVLVALASTKNVFDFTMPMSSKYDDVDLKKLHRTNERKRCRVGEKQAFNAATKAAKKAFLKHMSPQDFLSGENDSDA